MSADGMMQAAQGQERAQEFPGHQHPREMLSNPEEIGPLGTAQNLPHIKNEPKELHLEGISQDEGTPSVYGWTSVSHGSRAKALLPGGAHPSPQVSALSQERRTRERHMASALLTAWSQMPVTFEDVALYLSREEWGHLDKAQQSFCRDTLQKTDGLALGFPFSGPFWSSQVQDKGEASSSSQQTGDEKEEKAAVCIESVELGKEVLNLAASGDMKPFRTRVDRAPGDTLHCGQLAAGSQAADNGLPRALEEGQLKPALSASSLPVTAATNDSSVPEKPSKEEDSDLAIPGEENNEEGLAVTGNNNKKTYRCEQCSKRFTWHSHLVTHRRTHTGEKPYACTDCGKRFGRSSHLIQHQIIHTGEKPYTCPSCWKSFSHHSTLIQHQRIHTGEKPYVCNHCAKRFTRRSDLVTHQGTHTGAKPHKCPVCSKCFTQSSALVTHQRTHTGIKPYPCPECGKCFSQRSNLIAHNRTHTGEKPYHCLDCGKSFSHSSHLTAHQRTHRGVRPYSCPLCGKSFSRRSNLHRHEKIHTTGPKALAMLMLGAAAAGALVAPAPQPT